LASLALRDGWCVWVKLYTPAGLIFSKSRVRGYGRLGKDPIEHRQLRELFANKIGQLSD